MRPKDTNELLQELAIEMAKPPRFEPTPVVPAPTEQEIQDAVKKAMDDILESGCGIEHI
jgi:hypothetical protein